MRSNAKARNNDNAALSPGEIVGLVVAVIVFAVSIPIAAGQLATAQANGSVTTLGIAPFMVVVAIVVIAAVLVGFTRHSGQ